MVKKYFENMKKSFFEENLLLENKISEYEKRIKEIDRFIEILDGECDEDFDLFSPRSLEHKNKIKIKELQEEKQDILEKIANESDLLMQNKKKEQEIDSMIMYMKQDKNNNLVITELEEIELLIEKINSALPFMDMDRNRFKIELLNIVAKISSKVDEIKKMCQKEEN